MLVKDFPRVEAAHLICTDLKGSPVVWHFDVGSADFLSLKHVELELVHNLPLPMLKGLYSVRIPDGITIGTALRCEGEVYLTQENMILLGQSPSELLDIHTLIKSWKSMAKLTVINRQFPPFVIINVSSDFLMVMPRKSYWTETFLSKLDF